MIAIYIVCVILACLVGYLLGSLPFSVWIGTLATGIDLREHGVKNPGGMNAAATYGLKIGLPIIFLDFLKGTALASGAIMTGLLSSCKKPEKQVLLPISKQKNRLA